MIIQAKYQVKMFKNIFVGSALLGLVTSSFALEQIKKLKQEKKIMPHPINFYWCNLLKPSNSKV